MMLAKSQVEKVRQVEGILFQGEEKERQAKKRNLPVGQGGYFLASQKSTTKVVNFNFSKLFRASDGTDKGCTDEQIVTGWPAVAAWTCLLACLLACQWLQSVDFSSPTQLSNQSWLLARLCSCKSRFSTKCTYDIHTVLHEARARVSSKSIVTKKSIWWTC